ncbi:MAG: hypothetical protein GY906_01300, partial [bacterium]|nr:hypothetical protein [bacterium]
MNEDRTHECLIQLTAQAATQHEGMQREVAEDGAHEPMPGDLYVFLETADLPVEWMVVELRGDDSQKVRVVPTDSNPLMGPADKSVPEDDPSGPLSVRSGFGVWLPGSALSHEQRVGRVDRAWVDRHLPLALIDEPTMDPAVATEYLVDPELNDWIESVPAKAQALLSSQSLSPPQDKTQMVPLHARSFM